MRRVRSSIALASTVLVAMATLAACGGDDDDGGGDNQSESEGQAGGEITVRGCNPENPLIPGNTAETCGGNVLDVTTAKLIKYATEDAAPQNDIAESIETEDNQNFTVTLKDGYMFSDGTPGDGRELRRRLELQRLRPQRLPVQLLLRADRRVRRPAVHR